MTRRTPAEIEQLKKAWLVDPCWDIETTEGFEEHRAELEKFSKEFWFREQREYEIRERQQAELESQPDYWPKEIAHQLKRLNVNLAALESRLEELIFKLSRM